MRIPRTTVVLMAVTFLAGLCLDSAILRIGAQTAGDNPELARMYAEDQFAIGKGEERAKWLAAATEDRLDGLRREFKAPSLADARAKEAIFNKK